MQQMSSVTMSNSFAQMVNGIEKNNNQLLQSLPQRNNTCSILLECRDDSFYFNTQKVEFTYPPHAKKTKNQNKKQNYDGVETRKKLALYENIKFYDYIP